MREGSISLFHKHRMVFRVAVTRPRHNMVFKKKTRGRMKRGTKNFPDTKSFIKLELSSV